MKYEMRFGVMICTLSLLLLLSAVSPAAGLRVDGAILEADVLPGEHIRHEMMVRIGEDEIATDAEASLMGFGTNCNGVIEAIDPAEDESPYSAREFFEVSPGSFHLDPGVPVKVVLEGDIPEDAGSGGRYAIVLIHTAPQGSGAVGFATAILVPISLTINGTDIVKTGEIAEIKVYDDEVLSISFENTGNCYYGVTAEVILRDESDDVIKTISTQKGISLPTVTYPFTVPLNSDDDLTSGCYTVEASVVRSDGEVMGIEETTFEV